jgi:hypothetical protein
MLLECSCSCASSSSLLLHVQCCSQLLRRSGALHNIAAHVLAVQGQEQTVVAHGIFGNGYVRHKEWQQDVLHTS